MEFCHLLVTSPRAGEKRMTRETSEAREEVWAALMRAALAGDEQAYRRLLGEIGRVVRPVIRGAFARARLGDADIEDVVQETLLAIHLKRQTWDPSQRLTPWINAIARHKAIDAMRRRGARRVEPIEDFEAVIAAPEQQDPHTRSDVERLMEQLSAARARHRALDFAGGAVDYGDRGAPRHDRSRGARRAASGAEVARRRVEGDAVMKTDDLILALSADAAPRGPSLRRRVALGLAIRRAW